MEEKDDQQKNILTVNPHAVTLSKCIDKINILLEDVQMAAEDYFNSTPLFVLSDAVTNGNGLKVPISVPIDLKTMGVIAAIAQSPLALRGSTDRGKTALAERILSGLFGSQKQDWWRMEVNRGMTIDELIDIDCEKLANSKLSRSVEAAEWLGRPARLLDEINRAHPKLLNLVLHLADGSGFNVRGNLAIHVGQPYHVDGEEKRYSFTIVTANQFDSDYAGVFEEDMALTRRIVLSIDLDEIPPSSEDIAKLLTERRAKSLPRSSQAKTIEIIELYESLPRLVPFQAVAHLFLLYLAGRNLCAQSKCGRIKPSLKPGICDKCHVAKAHRFCGRVGGLSEGLMLWTKELAAAIAVVRAALALRDIRRQCLDQEHLAEYQQVIGRKVPENELYDEIRKIYLSHLNVTGEDIKAAFILIAPTHVYIDSKWLKNQTDCECNPFYVFQEVARESWEALTRFLKDYQHLVKNITDNGELSAADRSEIERIVKTQDPAILTVVSALRCENVPNSIDTMVSSVAQVANGENN